MVLVLAQLWGRDEAGSSRFTAEERLTGTAVAHGLISLYAAARWHQRRMEAQTIAGNQLRNLTLHMAVQGCHNVHDWEKNPQC